MKMFVGLGNPGKEYENTRHNVGFMVIDSFLDKNNMTLDQKKFKAEYAKKKINGEDVLVVKPQTYMNLSGEAVRALADYYKVDAEDIVVVYDDMDLPLGKLRLRKNGSGGGHNGIKNIIQQMGTKEIKRIRVGIEKNKLIEQKDFVLGHFNAEERATMLKASEKAAEALTDFTKESFDKLMNKYNTGE